MAKKYKKRSRKTRAIQTFWEGEFPDLETMNEFLQEGQEGDIAGENTPNPEYIASAWHRRKRRMQCMTKLQALLPIHEAEAEVAALEQKIMQLLALIDERAIPAAGHYQRKSTLVLYPVGSLSGQRTGLFSKPSWVRAPPPQPQDGPSRE